MNTKNSMKSEEFEKIHCELKIIQNNIPNQSVLLLKKRGANSKMSGLFQHEGINL